MADIHSSGLHGLCFDEGMSGRCGFECRVFTTGDCELAKEMILDNLSTSLSDIEGIEDIYPEIIEEAKKTYIGELKLAVIRVQKKYVIDELEMLSTALEEIKRIKNLQQDQKGRKYHVRNNNY